jgi:ABC-type multidrug transport system ATPase subunit
VVGKAVIVVAHRLSTIIQADELVIMQQGAVVERGTHETLKGRPDGVYAKLYHLHEFAERFNQPAKVRLISISIGCLAKPDTGDGEVPNGALKDGNAALDHSKRSRGVCAFFRLRVNGATIFTRRTA